MIWYEMIWYDWWHEITWYDKIWYDTTWSNEIHDMIIYRTIILLLWYYAWCSFSRPESRVSWSYISIDFPYWTPGIDCHTWTSLTTEYKVSPPARCQLYTTATAVRRTYETICVWYLRFESFWRNCFLRGEQTSASADVGDDVVFADRATHLPL